MGQMLVLVGRSLFGQQEARHVGQLGVTPRPRFQNELEAC